MHKLKSHTKMSLSNLTIDEGRLGNSFREVGSRFRRSVDNNIAN